MPRLARVTAILLIVVLPVLSLFNNGADTTSRINIGNSPQYIGVQQTSTQFFYLPLIVKLFAATPTATSTYVFIASPTATRTLSPFPYTLQDGSPVYLTNFANTAGCNWQGIAGQVFNLAGQPQIGLIVHLEGGGLNLDTITGSKQEYGPAGYEFFLTSAPQTTTDTYHIQLRTTGGASLSDVYIIPTFANSGNTCPKNLALVIFVQNH